MKKVDEHEHKPSNENTNTNRPALPRCVSHGCKHGEEVEDIIIIISIITIIIIIKTGMMMPARMKDVNRRKASHDEGKLAPELGRTKKKQREQKASKNLSQK